MSGDPKPEPDLERVVELRRAPLERAGYDPGTADALAVRTDIALQDALAPRCRCSRRRSGRSSDR